MDDKQEQKPESEKTVEQSEVEAGPPVRDWTRPPEWEPVDKNVRHRMSNRVRKARVAITRLAEQGAPQMLGWLQDAANGIPKRNLKGEPLRDSNGSIMWLVKPDPLGAFKAMSDVMDYHLPRLSRQDVDLQAKVEQQFDPQRMTTAELQTMVLNSLGILSTGEPVEPIDVEAQPCASNLQERATGDD